MHTSICKIASLSRVPRPMPRQRSRDKSPLARLGGLESPLAMGTSLPKSTDTGHPEPSCLGGYQKPRPTQELPRRLLHLRSCFAPTHCETFFLLIHGQTFLAVWPTHYFSVRCSGYINYLLSKTDVTQHSCTTQQGNGVLWGDGHGSGVFLQTIFTRFGRTCEGRGVYGSRPLLVSNCIVSVFFRSSGHKASSQYCLFFSRCYGLTNTICI